jgi:hypothetical protein
MSTIKQSYTSTAGSEPAIIRIKESRCMRIVLYEYSKTVWYEYWRLWTSHNQDEGIQMHENNLIRVQSNHLIQVLEALNQPYCGWKNPDAWNQSYTSTVKLSYMSTRGSEPAILRMKESSCMRLVLNGYIKLSYIRVLEALNQPYSRWRNPDVWEQSNMSRVKPSYTSTGGSEPAILRMKESRCMRIVLYKYSKTIL